MEYYRDMACRATSTISAVRYDGSGNRNKVDDYGSRAIDIRREIDKEIDQLADMRKEAMEIIRQIEDTRYQEVLESTYILAGCMVSWYRNGCNGRNYGL